MPYPWEVQGGFGQWAGNYLQQQADHSQAIALQQEQQRRQEQQRAMDMANQMQFQHQRDANLAAYQQQHTAQQADIQRERDYFGAYVGEQGDFRQAGIQAQRDQRLAEIQRQQTTHSTDEQGRLNQIQLGHAEQMRLARLKQARSAIEANQDLSPQERQMLITQVESGLNPLENRLRESQMLHTNIQTQQAQQQTQQQATLFNQHQQWLSQGIQGQLQTVVDPITGMPGLFHVDAQGRIQQLDFSQQTQLAQARLEAMQAGTQQTQQQTVQSAGLFPGQLALQGQNLLNQQQAYANTGQSFPLHQRILSAQAGTAEANLQMLPQHLDQERRRMDLEIQRLGQQVATQPQNTLLAQQHQQLTNRRLQLEVDNSPTMQRLHQEALELQNQHSQGQINQQQFQAQMQPLVQNATLEHTRLTNGLLEAQVATGGMTPNQIANLREHVEQHVDATITNGAFRFTAPPAGETPAQRDTRRLRERNMEVERRFNQVLQTFRAPQTRQGAAPQAPNDVQLQQFQQMINQLGQPGGGAGGGASGIPATPPLAPGGQAQRSAIMGFSSPTTAAHAAAIHAQATSQLAAMPWYSRGQIGTALDHIANISRAAANEGRPLNEQELRTYNAELQFLMSRGTRFGLE